MNNVSNQITMESFSLNHAMFAVDGHVLLKPLTLAFAPYKVTGLIGHNGSGKSTLIKMLSRQQPVSSGQIYWRGRLLSEWSSREFARQVAYLPQNVPTAEGMTVKELVSLGRYAWHGALGRFSQRDRDYVAQALKDVDLNWAKDLLVDQLSGGERQRAWIAMCMVQGSHCLLLDEPTSALDIAHQKEVLSLIDELSAQIPLTVIMVIHDINMAARYCDEIVALRQGEMVFHGTPTALMTSQQLNTIYGIAMGVLPHPDDNGYYISYIK